MNSIRQTVHDLQPEQNFHKIMDLTLTFDLMTLTLYQLVAFIVVNPHTKFGFNPTYSTLVITRNAQNRPTNNTAYRVALVARLLHKHLALIDVYSHINFGSNQTHSISYINKNVRLLRTNGPTNQPTDGRTNQPTNQPTNKTIHRDASQSPRSVRNA